MGFWEGIGDFFEGILVFVAASLLVLLVTPSCIILGVLIGYSIDHSPAWLVVGLVLLSGSYYIYKHRSLS